MSGLYKSGDGNLYSDDGSNVAVIDNQDGTFSTTIAGTEIDQSSDLDEMLARQGLKVDDEQ